MFSYADVMRLALQTGEAVVIDQDDVNHLPRPYPATQTHSAIRTGDRITGQFEMMRTKDGGRIFVGENGQYIRRW